MADTISAGEGGTSVRTKLNKLFTGNETRAPFAQTALAADDAHDITISPGNAWASGSGDTKLEWASSFTKQIDAAWSAGSDAGGFLPAGGVQADSAYHLFAIATSAGSVDFAFDDNLSCTNIPSGYTLYRRIGSYLTDGSANLVEFRQNGSFFTVEGQLDLATPDTGIPDLTLKIPHAGLLARIAVIGTNTSTTYRSVTIYEKLPSGDRVTVAVGSSHTQTVTKPIDYFETLMVSPDENRQIAYQFQAGGSWVAGIISTTGWLDFFNDE